MKEEIEKVREDYHTALARLGKRAPEVAAGFPEAEAIRPLVPRPTLSGSPGGVSTRAGNALPEPTRLTKQSRPVTRGLGSLYQRGHVWWVQYCFRGKVYRESSGSPTRADAVKLLRRRLAEMGRGRLVGPDLEKTTLADLKRMHLDDYRANSRKALKWAETSWTAVEGFFPETTLARDVTLDRLNAYVVARLDAKKKPATIKNELAVLKRALHLAEKAGKAICPPFPTISVQNARTGFFEANEFQAVCARLPEDLRPVVTFAYLTGWRKQEILSLTWDRVDFAAGTIRLEPGTTKNDEGRTFPFTALPPLEDLLRRQRLDTIALERRSGLTIPWVFHRNGRPIKDFRGAWKQACKTAGCPGRIPHDFRRTAVRNLERAGVPRSVAMKLTGHKTESVYRRYAIVSEADLAQGVAKLAALQPLEVKPADEGISTVLTQIEGMTR